VTRSFPARALVSLALLALAALHSAPLAAHSDGTATAYRELCASCHGVLRYGGYAPPLIPLSLGRKSDEELAGAILEGRPNTQMPPFGAVLDEQRARALVALLREPVGEVAWDLSDIERSRIESQIEAPRIPASVRRRNVTLVVERATGSISVLDGDSLRELDRFHVGAIHGGPKFDRAYRKFVAATRDGTVVHYDLESGGVRHRVKVAVNTRNLAISPAGDLVAVANQLPANLVLLDGDLRPLRIFPLPGQPSGVYQLPGEDRFVLTLRDAPYLYALEYPALALHRVELPEAFEDFVFVPGRTQLLASSRGGRRVLLYDLRTHQVLGSLATEGLPHLFSACFFERNGTLHAALNHVGLPLLSIIDMTAFRIATQFSLRGAGFFVRTHPGTPYLWADTNTEAIQLVDKKNLELLDRALVPEGGKTAMHVEFTADGGRALVSVWHEDGAVVVYDSTTLEEVARLPYAIPVGKYNAFNKTHLVR
jgi:mono/diheme cytochrome c family protein